MRRSRVRTLAAAALLALATADPDATGTSPDTPARKTPTPTPAPDPLAGPLSERIAGKQSLEDVELDLIWGRDAVRVYGAGVGICGDASEIRVPHAEIVALLEAARKARFGSMPDRFGKLEAEGIVRLKGRLTARIGELSKAVSQMRDGEQSPELAALAARLLKTCEAASKTGVRAADLSDGLSKLAAGKLAPEAFEALAQRRESRPASGSPPDNWILRIEGRRASDRLMPVGQKPGPPKWLALSETQFRDLVRLLSVNDVGALPGSVYSAEYTDLRVKVLNREKTVAGRRLGGAPADSPGAARQSFDRILEGLHRLHLEIQASGRPDSGPVVLRSEPDSEIEEGERERHEERDRDRERTKPAISPSPARP